MQPIQDLLHRIRWDPEFGRGIFAIGYEDRPAHPPKHEAHESRERVVPLVAISMDAEHPGTFAVHDAEEDAVVRIPFHRVRAVYKDGVAIWRRASRPAED